MKQVYSILTLILSVVTSSVLAQNLQWTKQMGGSYTDKANSVTVDNAGNVYTTGYFEDSVDFNPGSGTFNLTSVGGKDIFITKLDDNGNFIWAKQIGGVYNEESYSITADNNGYIYITGYFEDTVDFDPDTSTFNLVSNGSTDIFVTKLDTNGNLVWAKQLRSGSPCSGKSITVDNNGNVYTTGTFRGGVDFDPGPGSFNIGSSGFNNDVFISKLDANGNFIWAKRIGGTLQDLAGSIAVDDDGNVFTTGSFKYLVDFDPGPGTFYLTSTYSGSRSDIFVSKLDSNGNFIWAKKMGGIYSDYGYDIALDSNANVYVAGEFYGYASFGSYALNSPPNTGQGFITKLDSSGNSIWAKKVGSTRPNVRAYVYSLVVDSNQNVYATGGFNSSTSFSTSGFYLSPVGDYDAYALKLDINGNFVWVKPMGSTGREEGLAIAVKDSVNVYVCGSFQGTTYFLNERSEFNMTTAGNEDAFVFKLGCNKWNFIYPIACDNYTSPSGNYTWSTSGTYVDTLPGTSGCDTLIGVNLKITSIANQTVSTTNTYLCKGDSTTIAIGNSETGTDYYLIDNATSSIVDGPIAGTGAGIAFNTGNMDSTTGYYVFAETPMMTSNSALNFDGIDDKIDCGNDSSIQISGATITLEAWIYPTAWKNNVVEGNIINKEGGADGYMIRCGDNGSVSFTLGDGSVWSDLVAPQYSLGVNIWQHVAATYDGTTMRLYVNGVMVASRTASINISARYSNLTIARGFIGNIDNVRIWNVSRTAAEINATKDSCLLGNEPGLVALYKCDEGLGGDLLDASPNGNNGILTNMNFNTAWVTGIITCSPPLCNKQVTPNITITVAQPTSSAISPIACDNYTSPSNNYTWNTSGIYMDTIPNAAGCDSVITINLTINNSAIETDVITACNSYTWIDGNTYTSNNNTATYTLTNTVGCDSIVTLDLTINNSSTNSITQVACNNYISPSGNYVWNTSGIYVDTISNITGCDSIITIDLTVNTVNVAVTDTFTNNYETTLIANAANASYQWVLCQNYVPISGDTNQTFIPFVNGYYAVIVTQNNCTDTSACIPVGSVGIKDITSDNIKIYPNPNKGRFTIATSQNALNISIYSIEGKEIITNLPITQSQQVIDLGEMSKGVYIVKVSNKTDSQILRLVIE